MQKMFGLLLMALVLLSGGTPAFAQSTPPSVLNTKNPVSSPFLHFFYCYDAFTLDPLNCQVFDQLVGLVPPPTEAANTGGHLQHTAPAPLIDKSTGANGFICLVCTDSNPDPLIIQAFTNSATAVIRHQVPQFAGRIQVHATMIPPSGWSCLVSCNFDFVEEIGVDGLSELPFPGPNLSYQNSRLPNPDTFHPQGSSGTSDTLVGVARIALGYLNKKGAGLKINDLSLPRGGKFDLGSAYQENDPAHVSHRTGNDVDIGKVDIAGNLTNCFQDKNLQQILKANGVGFTLCHPSHLHIRFN